MRPGLFIFAATLFFVGCETTFDPRGTFEDRLVLFGLLTPETDTVTVRLQATYDSPAGNPLSPSLEPDLSGGTAALLWEGGSVAMHDTVVAHPDSGRYTNGLHLFSAAPLRVTRRAAYTVRVDVPGYPRAEATVIIPGTTDFYIRNEGALTSPSQFPDRYFDLIVSLQPESYGFLPRLYVEYQILSEGGRLERREIPSRLDASSGGVRVTYPTFQPASVRGKRQEVTDELYQYEAAAYRQTLGAIGSTYGASNVRFVRVMAYVTAADEHFYTYYYLLNGFFDPFTVRTDRPDYSNVRGGIGIVGAFAVDSAFIALPPSGL